MTASYVHLCIPTLHFSVLANFHLEQPLQDTGLTEVFSVCIVQPAVSDDQFGAICEADEDLCVFEDGTVLENVCVLIDPVFCPV